MKPIFILRRLSGLMALQLFLVVFSVSAQDNPDPGFQKIESFRFQLINSSEDQTAPAVSFAREAPKADRFQLFPPMNAMGELRSGAGQFARDIWTDQKTIWTSPFRMNRRQFFTIALPLAVATAGLIATDKDTANYLANTPGQIRWSERFGKFGDIYTLGLLTGGMLVGGKVINKPHYSRIGRNAAEALVSATLANIALKGIFERERPDHANGDGRFFHGGLSFPSGHTMNSWAVAIAVARSPQCPKWLAYTSYAMATAISVSRWSAHKHFPSDILVGGVFGGLIGNYVVHRPR